MQGNMAVVKITRKTSSQATKMVQKQRTVWALLKACTPKDPATKAVWRFHNQPNTDAL